MNIASSVELYSNHPIRARYKFQGLYISIENPAGSVRTGKDHTTGKPWRTKMRFDYGYIRLTKGTDGDHVDCYIGPNENAKYAYVVHQNDPHTGKYDEDKVMLGFDSPKHAKSVYLMHYDDPDFYGSMSVIPMTEFKRKALATKDRPKSIKAKFDMREMQLAVNPLDFDAKAAISFYSKGIKV